eukprot:scaffold7026_cov65-Phaeocystis_antarctica.AAC.7
MLSGTCKRVWSGTSCGVVTHPTPSSPFGTGNPSRPPSPSPQLSGRPSSKSSSVCRSPHAAATTLPRAISMHLGVSSLSASPCPSWPYRPRPQVHTVRSAPTKAVWC